MSLFGKQIFAILEKPLDLTMKLILDQARGSGSASHAGSKDGLYKPSPSTHAPITSNPLVPAFLLLLVGFLVLYSSPVQTWLKETDGLPTLVQIFSFSRKQKQNVLPKESENVSVWAKAQSGFYYCQGGTLFGSEPGAVMAQGDALTSGYRPSGGEYCAGDQQVVADSGNPPADNQQRSEQASISAPQEESFGQGLAKPSDISNAEAGIRVWAIQELGSYYCRGQILFGSDRGKLMSQSGALSAGYRPSVGRCTDDKPKEAVASNVHIGPQQLTASATVSTPQGESLPLVSTTPVELPKEGSAQVWVKKQFGFYYCRNDVLFGNQPGQLMTQASALDAGYQPSDSHCTDAKPTPTTPRPRSHGLPGTK